MKVYIITTEKIVYNNVNAYCVSVPGAIGYFQILNNHDSILSILNSGIIKIKLKNNIINIFKINFGGLVEVNNNIINIMVYDIEKL
ncbi:MAG: F0F1 ATP synthase subunit epsilon [Candidatus Bostrichicola ureolyticus]|nr:MAG: F0F1 ATP synthase subunit epsilon [Candidatus Bostrichicola ureolyticus]